METQNKTVMIYGRDTWIRFTLEEAQSFFKILKLVNSHVQVTQPGGSHFLVIGEEPRRRNEYLRIADAVFIEKMLDKLSDVLEVKL